MKQKFDNKDKPAPRPPTADDLWLDELREGCARAMATYLKEGTNTQRPIRSLTLAEMKNLAEACTAKWIVMVSKKIAEDRAAVKPEYANLLLG
jgi:hypothetical protein